MNQLFHNSKNPVTVLKPRLTLENFLQEANNGNLSYLINMVRLNWMVNDIRYNGMQKPILVDGAFNIITGDTRAMALRLNPKVKYVPLLMSSTVAPKVGWQLVQDKKHLGKLLNIHPDDILTNYEWKEKQLDWIEFAFMHTQNHMHDESQRERMILNYLAKYPDTIFDQDWLLSSIDWSLYDH